MTALIQTECRARMPPRRDGDGGWRCCQAATTARRHRRAAYELIEAVRLDPVFVPDIYDSLWMAISGGGGWAPLVGGTRLADLKELGGAMHALAIGEQMRTAALALQDPVWCARSLPLFDQL
ncbi:MAG: hypothetical protein IPM01_13720 [Burkholderiaceae bacterium]|nr:hypothetical protein [Burkholderiaceae bacterium]